MIKQYWFKCGSEFKGVFTAGGCINAVDELCKVGYEDVVLVAIESYPDLYLHGLHQIRRTRPIGPQRAAKKRKKLWVRR